MAGLEGAASPTSAAAGMADGQEIAMRMIQAAEAASLAARSAAEALNRRNSGGVMVQSTPQASILRCKEPRRRAGAMAGL